MEKSSTKLQKGFWDKLPTGSEERAPKVTFDLNVPEVVTFLSFEPREGGDSATGVYYTFDVKHNGIETVLQTSAITLLQELKKHAPLENKTLKITKKSDRGRQYFIVEQA